jgi:four helix bundle protein
MQIRDFRDLEVWQKSMDLAVDVYGIARQFPREERFELTSQLRKAVVSVSSNIAEGSGRATTKDLLNFLSTARGSLRESESLLLLSQRLGYVSEQDLKAVIQLVHRIGQMLTALRKKLRKKLKRKKPASR